MTRGLYNSYAIAPRIAIVKLPQAVSAWYSHRPAHFGACFRTPISATKILIQLIVLSTTDYMQKKFSAIWRKHLRCCSELFRSKDLEGVHRLDKQLELTVGQSSAALALCVSTSENIIASSRYDPAQLPTLFEPPSYLGNLSGQSANVLLKRRFFRRRRRVRF